MEIWTGTKLGSIERLRVLVLVRHVLWKKTKLSILAASRKTNCAGKRYTKMTLSGNVPAQRGEARIAESLTHTLYKDWWEGGYAKPSFRMPIAALDRRRGRVRLLPHTVNKPFANTALS